MGKCIYIILLDNFKYQDHFAFHSPGVGSYNPSLNATSRRIVKDININKATPRFDEY